MSTANTADIPAAFWRDPVERAKSDPAAFGQLYDRYAGQIYRFVRARVHDDGLAERLAHLDLRLPAGAQPEPHRLTCELHRPLELLVAHAQLLGARELAEMNAGQRAVEVVVDLVGDERTQRRDHRRDREQARAERLERRPLAVPEAPPRAPHVPVRQLLDERGEPVPNDLTTGLIGGELLAREPGKAVIYDLRSSRAVAEYITEHGGIPVRERVGHSFMKATLRERQGIFGGELAGHYYFRDHYYADCAILALVELLNLRRQTDEPLSQLVAPLARYQKSPEINFVVEDKAGKIAMLAERYAGAQIDYLDGITISYPDWWANIRPSNTEPYLRLVLEAKTAEELARRRAELTALLGKLAAK